MAKLRDEISKGQWEKLEPAIQKYYTKDEDDNYALERDGRQKPGEDQALKNALTRVKADRDALREDNAAKQKKLDDLDTNDARLSGDMDRLTEQWAKKEATTKAAHETEVAGLHKYIENTAIDGVVNDIAGRNTKDDSAAALLKPHIRGQLSVDFGEDGPQVMMTVNGLKQVIDVKAFEKSVVDNTDYGAIIVKKKGSGGDAPGTNTPGNEGGAFSTDKTGNVGNNEKPMVDMTPHEIAAKRAARKAQQTQ